MELIIALLISLGVQLGSTEANEFVNSNADKATQAQYEADHSCKTGGVVIDVDGTL